jgi:hypothetical protein
MSVGETQDPLSRELLAKTVLYHFQDGSGKAEGEERDAESFDYPIKAHGCASS